MHSKRRLKVLAGLALAAVLLVPAAALTCPNDPVRIYGAFPVYYTSIQAAYNASDNGDVIQTRAVGFTEDIVMNRNVTVTFDGGYNCAYTAKTGDTIVTGSMDINDGEITVGGYTLQE